MPLDVKIRTPENMIIRYNLAGIATRGMAFFYDSLFQILILLAVNFMLYNFIFSMLKESFFYSRSAVDGISIAVNFIVIWFYHVFFEVFRDGQTPGKAKMNIRVVMSDGHRIEFFPSVTRNILRVIDFFPFLFATGIISLLVTKNHQRLGDLVAGTIVIRDMDYNNILDSIRGSYS
ncbi:RDD family protein [bacterium]|nr:RDD family protein [bacterium]